MDALRLDLRYAVRTLLRRPGFTLLAVLTLAIGIGVNAVAFTALNALLLRHLDRENADSLGWIMTSAPGGPTGEASLPDYHDIARSTRVFDTVVAEGRTPLSLRTDQGAEQAWGLLVSAEYLRALNAAPELGRVFTAADLEGGALPAVISHRFWERRLGGGSSIAGRSIVLNGRSFSVLGVLPDDFEGPGGVYAPDVWIPLERMDLLNLSPALETRGAGWLTVIGRLRPGATAVHAQEDLRNLYSQLARDYPDTHAKRTATFYLMSDGHPDLRAISPLAWMAMALVGIVLLIACFNVAGLLLARAAERQQEVAVRAALGAGRWRILRQLVTEGMLLALLAGAAALLVAAWSSSLLTAFSLPAPIPQRLHLDLDRRIVGFIVALVAFAGVLPALAPALQAARIDLGRAMKLDSMLGARPARVRNLFVMAQVAGSTLFLAGALLFARSFLNASTTDPGFDAGHVATVQINPAGYGYDVPRSRALVENLVSRVSGMPGVAHVAAADLAPFFVGFARSAEVSADGSNCEVTDCRRALTYAVGRGYFDALGLPLTAGRDFTPAEMTDGSSVIVSAYLAEYLWPGETGVGRSFRMWPGGKQVTVVGVAADMKHRTMKEAPFPYVYRPLADADFGMGLSVIARSTNDPRLLLAALREQVRALDQDLPPLSISTMAERMQVPLWAGRTAAGFFLVCATLALVLAVVGLFGVTYYAVAQRTREFGVRVALGATPGRVISLVLREGLGLTIPGVLVGILFALIGARFVSALLVGVAPWDPATFAAAATLQALVALAACSVPAWRATRADPAVALREP